MNLKIIITASLLATSVISVCQTETNLNITDQKGMKLGHWIKRYPNGNVMYDGTFKDDHPVGEFKRFYDNTVLMSILLYSTDGKSAEATIFHPNGNIASRGKYVNQLKEGTWQFFSKETNRYLICKEGYSRNLKNGPSLKFYPDSSIAEKITYVNDVKSGPWTQYYPGGKVCLKSAYLNGQITGSFEVWFDNGNIEISGWYKDDARDGKWLIYNKNGTLRYQVEYKEGITIDHQMDIDESDYLDSLERNKGKIADPEKAGFIK